MSDDTMYPPEMYPGGSEAEFSRLRLTSTADFEAFVAARWGKVNPGDRSWLIAVMGLAGETGEVVEPLKKHYRDGKHPGAALLLEFGDVLHYLTLLASSYGYSLQDLMAANIRKLEARDAAKTSA